MKLDPSVLQKQSTTGQRTPASKRNEYSEHLFGVSTAVVVHESSEVSMDTASTSWARHRL